VIAWRSSGARETSLEMHALLSSSSIVTEPAESKSNMKYGGSSWC